MNLTTALRIPALLIPLLLAPLSAYGQESLPETVGRHEQEIINLKKKIERLESTLEQDIRRLDRAIGFLRKNMEEVSPNRTAGEVVGSTVCKKNVKGVGKIKISSADLLEGWEHEATGIILKYNSVELDFMRNYVIYVSSNIEELNNKPLGQGISYTFNHAGCGYVLHISRIYVRPYDRRFLYLSVILNYK